LKHCSKKEQSKYRKNKKAIRIHRMAFFKKCFFTIMLF